MENIKNTTVVAVFLYLNGTAKQLLLAYLNKLSFQEFLSLQQAYSVIYYKSLPGGL